MKSKGGWKLKVRYERKAGINFAEHSGKDVTLRVILSKVAESLLSP